MSRKIYPLVSLSLLLASLPLTSAHGADEIEVRAIKNPGAEQYERDVDRVALAAQDKAIAKLSALLRKYRATIQEPVLLMKLAELHQQNAAIHFRIAHGNAHHSKKTIDLQAYRATMKQSIATLSELIRKYPHYEEIHIAYFMRGKAHEEIEATGPATQDYLHLVTHFPTAEEATSAHMSLAEFSIRANNHARAIQHLSQVEKKTYSPHYPFALFKLSWSHYNLKNIPEALSYATKHIEFYNERRKDRGDTARESLTSTSDEAFRENMLLDTTVFFLEGYEQKLSGYQIDEALQAFRRLEAGPGLGKMLARYAKLLRSHGHEADLLRWKDQILVSEPDRPESLDVLITTYEDQLNKRHFAQVVECARDMVRLYKKHKEYDGFSSAQKLLLDTAETLQTIIVKNKGADGLSELSTHLASVYDSFTRIVDESDPRIPGVHYNLAETLFEIKDYETSTHHYRWVVEHGQWKERTRKSTQTISVPDASLKAIASRYEVLRQHQLVPQELTPISFTEESDSKLDPALSEWITWIDTHIDRTDQPIENFYFEANRTLYSQKRLKKAVERMRRFALEHPSSKFAIPSASLALDTFIATATGTSSSDAFDQWEATHDLANELLEVKSWQKTEFKTQVKAKAADASYKIVETTFEKKEYKSAMKRADRFLEKYTESARLADCLTLAGKSALALNEKPKAALYFSRLIQDAPNSEQAATAYLARAALHEEKYEFASAARDYRNYLDQPSTLSSLKSDDLQGLRRKALAYAWLSSDPSELRFILESKAICVDALGVDCNRYQALLYLQGSGGNLDAKLADTAFNHAKKGIEENRAIWGALALENSKDLAFRDRLLLIRRIADHWEGLDPLVQFSLLPRISASIPKTFQLNRMAMNQVAPLRAHEKHITRRVEAIREMENAATKVMKLPWARIRAAMLNELASLYIDLSRGLQSLSPPKGLPEGELVAYEEMVRGLAFPFEEKGQDIRRKAFEMASRFAVEDGTFTSVSEAFFQDNPSQAKALQHQKPLEQPRSLDLKLLEKLNPEEDWDDFTSPKLTAAEIRKMDTNKERIKALWAQAVSSKRWQQVAFFLQQAHEKEIMKNGALELMKGISLVSAGARGEGLLELETAFKEFERDEASAGALVLLEHYLASLSRERTQDALNLLKSKNPELVKQQSDTPILNLARTWTGG